MLVSSKLYFFPQKSCQKVAGGWLGVMRIPNQNQARAVQINSWGVGGGLLAIYIALTEKV